MDKGVLYVVATPIGNLGDMTVRAIEVLSGADVIAAEDTRHSARLLRHFGIKTPTVAFHEHNEAAMGTRLLARMEAGDSVALISDAGTPLLSDPGYQLVRLAHERGLRVVPVPGPSALAAALSVSGLPTDRFAFEGFVPSKAAARRERLAALRDEPRTLVFYEAPHRILDTLHDMAQAFGGERQAVVARELTKVFETVRAGTLDALRAWLQADPQQQKGEFVVLIHGAAPGATSALPAETERVLAILLEDHSVKQAVGLAAKITGSHRNLLYKRAVELRQE